MEVEEEALEVNSDPVQGESEADLNGPVEEATSRGATPSEAKEESQDDPGEELGIECPQSDETPITVQVIENEDETLEYISKYFDLPLDEATGRLQNEDLEGSLKILHGHLEGQPIVTLTITAALLKHMQEKQENCDLASVISEYLEKFKDESEGSQSLADVMEKIMEFTFEKIKSDYNDEGQQCLTLLGYLVHLKNQHVDTKLCFRLMELKFKNELAEPDPIPEGQGQDSDLESQTQTQSELTEFDPEDCSKVNQLLSILDRFSLITLKQTEVNQVTSKVDTSNTFTELKNNGVELDNSIKEYVKLKQKEDQDWSSVFDLTQLLRQEARSPKYERHFITLHRSLKEFGWPQKSYRDSLFFGAALSIWVRSQLEACKMLKDVYEFFMSDVANYESESEYNKNVKTNELDPDASQDQDEATEKQRDMEYFNLCRMILVYLEYERKENGNLKQPLKGQGDLDGGTDEMDNSKLFKQVDYLYRIKNVEFFDWVVNQATQFPNNELIQHFSAQLLLIPLSSKNDINVERKKRRTKWINEYCKNYCNQQVTQKRIFGLLETVLSVMKISLQTVPPVRVMQLAIQIIKSQLPVEGVSKCSWFLQEVMYLMNPSPLSMWQVDYDAKQMLGLRAVSKMFVDQGLDMIFLGMMTELEDLYVQKHYLDLHFRDFLETLKATAFFDGCVKKLLKSSELFLKLRNIFRLIIEGIEKNAYEEDANIKAACHILVFWYALILKEDQIQNVVPAYAFIKEEMENFYQKISHKQSPVAMAFDGEKQWHIYYRAQEETTGKILLNFMSSHDETTSGDLYRLAKILKETMNRKKDWWLVSYAVVATTTGIRPRAQKEFINEQSNQDEQGQGEEDTLVKDDEDENEDVKETEDQEQEESETQVPLENSTDAQADQEDFEAQADDS